MCVIIWTVYEASCVLIISIDYHQSWYSTYCGFRLTRVKTPLCRLMCYILCRSGYCKKHQHCCTSPWNVAVIADPPRSRPSRLWRHWRQITFILTYKILWRIQQHGQGKPVWIRFPPLTSQNTRGATSGKSDFFNCQRTFDGDKTITKDRPRLKRTTKLNATIVLSKPVEYKPCHSLFGHSILNLLRHLANGDLNYVFPISAMLICASLTHKYSQPKNANWLEFSWQLCATESPFV